MTRRRRLLLMAIAAAFIVSGLVAEWLVHGTGLRLGAIIDLLAGWVLAAAGLAAWVAAPRSRAGPLLLASAAGWFIGTLATPTSAFGRSEAGWLAIFLVQLLAGLLVQAVMTWPSGRLTRPTQLVVVAGGYLAAMFPQLWYQEPGYVVLGVLLAAGIVVDQHALTPARRAAYRPARDAGLLLAAGLAGIPTLSRVMGDLGWAVLATSATLWAITVGLAATVLAVGSIRRERRGLVVDLAVELQDSGVGGLDGELERLLREAAAAETADAPQLRTALTEARALATRNADLRAALAARVAELEASRRRILVVEDEELQELEQRLRDGAGARLRSLARALQTLLDDRTRRPFRAAAVEQRLTRSAEQVAEARAELDALALGLDPGHVAEQGLDVALGGLAARSSVPVRLSVKVSSAPGPSVATTLYFVASEALANVVRHARAEHAWLHLRADGHDCLLVVDDDGQGGADVSRGTGLAGLQDRLEVLGGTLFIRQRPGGGTRLQARIPTQLGATA
jgi:signal transduction histidine kinase